MSKSDSVAGSFRDPSGFLFEQDGVLYRQVNRVYADDYDLLMSSGLYEDLVAAGLLVRHEEADTALARSADAVRVLRPERVPFISYPYEWCFSALKDAALTTLAIQKKAYDHGMVLKDASAYNIQFLRGKPVFIDTLSFEKYREGDPWIAYRQFCQHFLGPLALMSRRDVRLGQLLRIHLDGIPLDLVSELLPTRTKFRPSLLMHLHLHAKSQKRWEGETSIEGKRRKIGRMGFQGIIASLESAVRKLAWRPGGTEWAEYYDETNYTDAAMEEKARLVGEYLHLAAPAQVWDLGANTGRFSRIAADEGVDTLAFDIDPAAVEKNYLDCRSRKETHILPLVLDLTNPTPGVGWENRERLSLLQRGPTDTALALALIHHIAISNNVPLSRVAQFFADVCRTLIIEFVPKSDSQVRRLLATRADIFGDYHVEGFEAAFAECFTVERSTAIAGTERRLYLMKRR